MLRNFFGLKKTGQALLQDIWHQCHLPLHEHGVLSLLLVSFLLFLGMATLLEEGHQDLFVMLGFRSWEAASSCLCLALVYSIFYTPAHLKTAMILSWAAEWLEMRTRFAGSQQYPAQNPASEYMNIILIHLEGCIDLVESNFMLCVVCRIPKVEVEFSPSSRKGQIIPPRENKFIFLPSL